jgi:hypothetical protein
MEWFGHFEWDHMSASDADVREAGELTVSLYHIGQAVGSEVFIRELAAAVIPAGEWAAFGGERMVMEVFGGDTVDPNYHAMLAVAVPFIRRMSGGTMMRMNGYETKFWFEHGQ